MRSLPKPRFDAAPSFYIGVLRRAAVLRSAWYSLRFRAAIVVGRGCTLRVHRTAKLDVDGVLVIGLAHGTRQGASVELQPRSTLATRGTVQIMRGARVEVGWDARVKIGDRSYLNDGATLVCATEISIGSGCAIAWNATIMDTDTHRISVGGSERPWQLPVRVADGCWIGAGATVLKGTTIAEGAVVAAGAVVASDVLARQLVGGVPARPLATDVSWTI